MRTLRHFLVLAAVLVLPAGALAQVTALTHATLIDGSGTAPQPDMTIILADGRIAAIGPAAALAAPAGAGIVDLAGKFIVPGIINAHGHVAAKRDPQLRQYALYGVTTTTSMGADPDDIVQYKDEQRRGILRGARILTVKARFVSTPKVPGVMVATPEEGRAKVNELVATGADFIKVWVDDQFGKIAKLSRAFCEAVLDEAHKRGKITMAHIYTYEDARMAVESGVDILAHDVRDRAVPDDFIALMQARHVTMVSTLAREEGMFVYGEAPSFLDDPFFRKGLTPERLEILKTKKRDEQANDPDRARNKRAFAIDQANLKRMSDAGLRIALGTDSGGEPDRFFIQGFAEHRQMELMVGAGLTPMQVIQSFSKHASEALGIDRDFGTLAQGKAADLLVLSRNPLDAITNMRAIETVYLGGRKFE